MIFLADSNFFYIIASREKGLIFGTFGLGLKNQERIVQGVQIPQKSYRRPQLIIQPYLGNWSPRFPKNLTPPVPEDFPDIYIALPWHFLSCIQELFYFHKASC